MRWLSYEVFFFVRFVSWFCGSLRNVFFLVWLLEEYRIVFFWMEKFCLFRFFMGYMTFVDFYFFEIVGECVLFYTFIREGFRFGKVSSLFLKRWTLVNGNFYFLLIFYDTILDNLLKFFKVLFFNFKWENVVCVKGSLKGIEMMYEKYLVFYWYEVGV